MSRTITRRPHRIKNRIGQRFDRLVVLENVGRKGRNVLWLCRCDCGGLARTVGPKLKTGHTKSCGCILKEGIRKTHGEGVRGQQTVEYATWSGMKKRCYNANTPCYSHYGGRGVTMFAPWVQSYETFIKWVEDNIGRRPVGRGWSIDRIDNNGNYEPGNIRWATLSQQNKNRRPFGRKDK